MERATAVETPERLRPAIVVTGASSGIGREFARIAAGEGNAMLLVARTRDALEALAAELSARGAVCAILPLDLAKPAGADAIADALASRRLYCDVLVNNAGFGLFGPASKVDARQQLEVLDVNARALTELTLRFLPGMLERNRGGIINVGSMTGYAPGPNMAVYYATKAYVHSFTTALALESGGRGVTITSLTPGFVRTGFFGRCQIGHTRLAKLYPRMDAADVARLGWTGFRQGKRHVVPGLANRVVATLARLIPEAGLGWLVRLLQR
jgi:short-subunit dehydrogenase